MDGMDEVKNDLEEKGYHIGASGGHIIITEKTFQQLHTITEELLDDALGPILKSAEKLISTVNEILPKVMQRTPEEIKRDIKYEKNPMRLKQLNRELNMSYKFWRKR